MSRAVKVYIRGKYAGILKGNITSVAKTIDAAKNIATIRVKMPETGRKMNQPVIATIQSRS